MHTQDSKSKTERGAAWVNIETGPAIDGSVFVTYRRDRSTDAAQQVLDWANAAREAGFA